MRAAEGLPRRRWTTAELERIAATGVFADARGSEERLELIGGQAVPMSPKGNRHEIVRDELSALLRMLVPPEARVSDEAQFNLDEDTYTQPDILVRPASILVPFVRGPDALLAIEVGDWSLSYDLTMKARIHAAHGVREH
jgi:Uma2 family endonuclease